MRLDLQASMFSYLTIIFLAKKLYSVRV